LLFGGVLAPRLARGALFAPSETCLKLAVFLASFIAQMTGY
jgi:hypothetical protein